MAASATPHKPATSTALYSDDCVEVLADRVRIHWYYFPTVLTKSVLFEDIREIVSAPEAVLSRLNSKSWGMGIGTVWWACADGRGWGLPGSRFKSSIVLYDGAWCGHGFSCRDRDAAAAAIHRGLEAYRNAQAGEIVAPGQIVPPTPDTA